MTPEEQSATLMGFQVRPNLTESQYSAVVPKIDKSLLKDFPAYFNWEDEGVVKPAGNQNPCGACYLFAGTAAIEAHACIYGNMCEKLSEQEDLSELKFLKIYKKCLKCKQRNFLKNSLKVNKEISQNLENFKKIA